MPVRGPTKCLGPVSAGVALLLLLALCGIPSAADAGATVPPEQCEAWATKYGIIPYVTGFNDMPEDLQAQWNASSCDINAGRAACLGWAAEFNIIVTFWSVFMGSAPQAVQEAWTKALCSRIIVSPCQCREWATSVANAPQGLSPENRTLWGVSRCSVTADPVDLLMCRPAFQSSNNTQFPGEGLASLTVAGDFQQSFPDGCTATDGTVTAVPLGSAENGTSNPWWYVDMGSTQPVESISVFTRADCCGERLGGAVLRVGDAVPDPALGTGLTTNSLCGMVSNVVSALQNIVVQCNSTGGALTGRYLSVQLLGKNRLLSLCGIRAIKPRGCDLPGYRYFALYDAPGSDIGEMVLTGTTDSMNKCNADPACAGFNTNGFIKGSAATLAALQNMMYVNFACRGFYLKDNSTPDEPSPSDDDLPGWAIAVIVVGSTFAVVAVAVLGFVMYRRRRTARQGAADPSCDPPLTQPSVSASPHSMSATAQKKLGSEEVGETGTSTDPTGPTQPLGSWTDSFEQRSSRSLSSNMLDGLVGVKTRLGLGPNIPLAPGAPEALLNQLSQSVSFQDEQLQVFDILGRGGNGIVYRGLWKGHFQVAAKVTVLHVDRRDKSQRQILEAMMSASLCHPNIVVTYHYDFKELGLVNQDSPKKSALNGGPSSTSISPVWQLVILQELCSGGTLHSFIAKSNPSASVSDRPPTYGVEMVHALQLALDVASGLEHLHSKNIVHSDLSPNNVLLQAVQGPPRLGGLQWVAKVADFGLSIVFENGRSHASRMFCGTAYYMAPETQNDGILSKQSDIFAFGILLCELATGVHQLLKHLSVASLLASLERGARIPEAQVELILDPEPASPSCRATAELNACDQAAARPLDAVASMPRGAAPASASDDEPFPDVTGTDGASDYGNLADSQGTTRAVSCGAPGGGTARAGRWTVFLPPCYPPEFKALVRECMELGPQRRPRIGDVKERLSAILKRTCLNATSELG